jgi:predicted GNAT family acetyltransferase
MTHLRKKKGHTMYQQNVLITIDTAPATPPFAAVALTVSALKTEHTAEALQFLAARPIHAVAMVGFINDNGIDSPLNRGTFYGCRNQSGELEGVALIGHAVLMETRSTRAVQAFANIAQSISNCHMIMGEQQQVEEFWDCYAKRGQDFRLASRELLFELRWPAEVQGEMPGLRRATLEDLNLVMPVHAELATQESGVNPMENDPKGFEDRCRRRIEQGRTWVLVKDGQLSFKAEVVSDTAELAYLEGIWVNPSMRGKNYGVRCLSDVCYRLLRDKTSVCLLVNVENDAAQSVYKRAGFRLQSTYDTIFLSQKIRFDDLSIVQ